MELVKKYYKAILCSIPIISLLLHWYVFKLDLVGIHVWRQTETQQVIDNFYREDMNILHPRVNCMVYPDRLLRLEFPIMQWVFALFYNVFGPHIIISRILSFIIGLFSIYGIYQLALRMFQNKVTATISAWCFSFSPVFYYYTMNPLPDNFSLCVGIWALCYCCQSIITNRLKYVVFSAICFGLSVLSKLPFVVFGSFIAAYFIIELKYKRIPVKELLKIIMVYLLLLVPAIVWYSLVIPTWGDNVVLKGMFSISQSKGELLHILTGIIVSVLPELLINYGALVFFIAGIYFLFSQKAYSRRYFPICMIWGAAILSYIALEMNTITTIHDYYLLPVLPPLFVLVGYGASQMLVQKSQGFRVLAIVCLAILPLTAFIRSYSRWDVTTDVGFTPVFYWHKDEIRKATPSDALCVVGDDQSDMILPYYIARKGWVYKDDNLNEAALSWYIKQGASYLYVTGRVDERAGIKQHLAHKIFEKEQLRIYKLK